MALLMGTAAHAASTVKLTIHWSSMDGVDLMAPIVIDGIEPGTTYKTALQSKGLEFESVYFKKAGYEQWSYYTSLKPITSYSSYSEELWYDCIRSSYEINENTDVYCFIGKELNAAEVTFTPPVCGTETSTPGSGTHWTFSEQTNTPILSCPANEKYQPSKGEAFWIIYNGETEEDDIAYVGSFEGGKDYYAYYWIQADFGYYFAYKENPTTGYYEFPGRLKVNNATQIKTWHDYDYIGGIVKITADHDWDAGTVTKQPTISADGTKLFKCKVCKATKTETLPKTGGSDGTAFGPGASAQAAEAAILALKNDKDPKGTAFNVLQLKAAKVKASSIKLTWKKASGAKSYVIYANKCGKGKKYQKLATVTGTSYTAKKVAGAKLKKGTYYKFLMVAVDANGKVVSTSKTVHAATTGGKVGNDKKVTTKAKKNKVTVKAKKTFKLAAKTVAASKKLKVKKHRAVSYESSNAKVATVSAKGVIKGVKKGKCKIYAYAQNGVCAVIKVTVK